MASYRKLIAGGWPVNSCSGTILRVRLHPRHTRYAKGNKRSDCETGIHCQWNHHFVGLNHHFAGLNQHLVRLNHHFVGLCWVKRLNHHLGNKQLIEIFNLRRRARLRPGRLCLSQQFRFRCIWSLGHGCWWRRWNNMEQRLQRMEKKTGWEWIGMAKPC